MFPKVVGYLLAVPLLVSIYVQLLVLASTAMSATTPVAMRRPRIARIALLVMLVAFSAMFAATILLFVVDRWYVVVSVVATWIATVFFLAAGKKQLAFAISSERVRRGQAGV